MPFLRAVLYAGLPGQGAAEVMPPPGVQEDTEEDRPKVMDRKEPRLLPGALPLREGLAAEEGDDTRQDGPEKPIRGAYYSHTGEEERHDTRRDQAHARWRTDVCGPWIRIRHDTRRDGPVGVSPVSS